MRRILRALRPVHRPFEGFLEDVAIKGLHARFKGEYGDDHPSNSQGLFRSMIAEEVLDMITTATYNHSRPAALALPKLRCADASWLRALPELMGEVSAQRTAVSGVIVDGSAVKGGVRLVAADVRTFPGTTAWSPPT